MHAVLSLLSWYFSTLVLSPLFRVTVATDGSSNRLVFSAFKPKAAVISNLLGGCLVTTLLLLKKGHTEWHCL